MTQTPHPNLQRAYDTYQQAKPENDIDLVSHIRQVLVSAGLGMNLADSFDNHRFVQEAHGKVSDVQRYLLNRYFGLQLSTCPNSMSARYSLIPNGTIDDWLRIFNSAVLPFMIQNQLPKVLPQV